MFDLSQSGEELARELLAQYPEGEETFDRGLHQQLLYDPTTRDPARYAEICRLAGELTDSAERKATFHLEWINGLRRVGGSWDIQAVLTLLEEARGFNALVQDETRRRRLEELRCYHAGIVHREAGQFDLAAQNQDEAAAAASTPDRRLIHLFYAAVERAYRAIVDGDVEQMRETRERVREAAATLDGLDEAREQAVRLKHADRQAHLLELLFFAGAEEDWEPNLAALLALSEPLASTYAHWRGAMQAADCLRQGRFFEAVRLANEFLHKGTYAATNVIALLILARANRVLGLTVITRVLLHQVVHYPGHGARVARAVASRELANLSS